MSGYCTFCICGDLDVNILSCPCLTLDISNTIPTSYSRHITNTILQSVVGESKLTDQLRGSGSGSASSSSQRIPVPDPNERHSCSPPNTFNSPYPPPPRLRKTLNPPPNHCNIFLTANCPGGTHLCSEETPQHLNPKQHYQLQHREHLLETQAGRRKGNLPLTYRSVITRRHIHVLSGHRFIPTVC